MRLLSRAQFARRRGISKARVTQLVQSGVIPLTVDGKINPEVAEERIKASIDVKERKKSRPPSNSGNQSLTDVRRDHEILKKQLTELRLQVETGELVKKSFAVDFLSLQVATAKAHFLGMPKRMAGELASISDAKEVEHLLRVEVRRILTELGRPLLAEKIDEEGGSKRAQNQDQGPEKV